MAVFTETGIRIATIREFISGGGVMDNSPTTVLIVDDDENLASNLQDILTAKGYAATAVFDSGAACDLCRDQSFDVCLVDIILPDLSGIALIEELNQLIPAAEFIITTGYASLDTATQAVKHKSVISYEIKPLDMDRLLTLIHQVQVRRRSEEALRETESKYQLLVESFMNPITFYDCEHRLQFINSAGARNLGGSPAAFIGCHASQIHPDVAPLIIERNNAVIQSGTQAQFEDYLELPAGGKWFWSTLQPVWDRDGNILGVQIISYDITDRKLAKESLDEREEMFRLVFENAHDEIMLMDIEGTILAVNTRVADIFGYYPDEIIGLNVFDLGIYRVDDVPALCRIFQAAVEDGKVFEQVELEVNHRDGHPVAIEVRTSLLEKDGQTQGVITLVQDITDRRRAEEEAARVRNLEELDRLRSALIASVSHELRTPLTSIKGIASSLIQPDVQWDRETQMDFLRTIDQSADRLTRIVNDLVEMAQLEAGMMKMRKKSVGVVEIVDAIRNDLLTLTTEHPLIVDILDGLPPVYVDDTRIGEVIINLVSNAATYSDAGSPIVVEAAVQEGQLVVSVTDRGIGIPEDQLGKVFDRFYRLEKAAVRSRNGTGLGLSICKGIIDQHQGRIWVESQQGVGSRFSFSLPLIEQTSSGPKRLEITAPTKSK